MPSVEFLELQYCSICVNYLEKVLLAFCMQGLYYNHEEAVARLNSISDNQTVQSAPLCYRQHSNKGLGKTNHCMSDFSRRILLNNPVYLFGHLDIAIVL